MKKMLRSIAVVALLLVNILPARAPGRIFLTAPLVLNVDAVNGVDVPGCGLSSGSAACKSFRSLPEGPGCWATLANLYDIQGQPVTCRSAPGQSYVDGGLRTSQALIGAGPTSTVVMDGNGATFQATACRSSFEVGNFGGYPNQTDFGLGVKFSISRMKLMTDGSSSVGGVPCDTIAQGPPGNGNVTNPPGGGVHAVGGVVLILDGVDFGTMPNGVHMFAEGAALISALYQSVTISGGAAYHVWAWTGANVVEQSDAVTLLNTPNFTGAFVRYGYGGGAWFGWTRYTGQATGRTFDALGNGGVLDLEGTTLPGDQSAGCTLVDVQDGVIC